MTRRLTLICLLLLFSRVTAQDLVAQDLLIRNARILDGTGAVIEQGSIVVRNGRLLSVSARASEAQGAVEIDAQGMTIIPGMIETHVHFQLVDRSFENQEALDDWVEQEVPGHLRAYLESGFTTAFSPGDHPDSILRVKRRIEAGGIQGPRLLVSGPVFTNPGAHPATTLCRDAPRFCRDHFAVEVTDADMARARVRELAGAGVDAIKAIYEANPVSAGKLPDDVVAAIAAESAQHGLPFIVHAWEAEDALHAVALGARRLVHPPIRGAFDGRQTAQSLIDASVPFSTTIHGRAPIVDEAGVLRDHQGREYTSEREAELEVELDRMRELWDRGATVAFGTDRYRDDPGADIAHEIETLSRVFSPAEILTALTHNAAVYLDLADELGTLEPGKMADMVILGGDPLAEIDSVLNVRVVIKSGEVVVDNR